jgi:hypothetical protein
MTTSDQEKPAAVADTGVPKIIVFKGVSDPSRRSGYAIGSNCGLRPRSKTIWVVGLAT